jgi:hypothetical protein
MPDLGFLPVVASHVVDGERKDKIESEVGLVGRERKRGFIRGCTGGVGES